MPTALVGTTGFEQTSQVSGRFGRIRASRWAGIGSRGSIQTSAPGCHGWHAPRSAFMLHDVRIAYFGLPLAALLLLDDGIEVELAVLSRVDAPGRRRIFSRLGPNRMLALGDASWEELGARLRASRPD